MNNKEIAVTIDPLCYFAQKIASDDYTFFSVVPAGRSPETYDPSFNEILRLWRSKAFFHINQLGIEQMLITSIQHNQADTHLFNISEDLNLHDFQVCHESHLTDNTDHNNCDNTHSHDPHIWTSFSGAKLMSENIFKALSSLNPEKAGFYQSNYLCLKDELDELESDLHRQLDTLSCRSFVIYHPALTYFADEFDLIQYSIEEEGKEPSAATLKKLIEAARLANVKVVFVQIEFDRKYAEQIAQEIGARIVLINPLDQNWVTQMKRIAKALNSNGATN